MTTRTRCRVCGCLLRLLGVPSDVNRTMCDPCSLPEGTGYTSHGRPPFVFVATGSRRNVSGAVMTFSGRQICRRLAGDS